MLGWKFKIATSQGQTTNPGFPGNFSRSSLRQGLERASNYLARKVPARTTDREMEDANSAGAERRFYAAACATECMIRVQAQACSRAIQGLRRDGWSWHSQLEFHRPKDKSRCSDRAQKRFPNRF